MKGFLKRILWPTDFSAEAEEALRYAGVFSRAFGSKIIALHVTPDFMPGMYQNSLPVQRELLRRQAELKEEARAKLRAYEKRRRLAFQEALVVEGSPAKKVIEVAERAKVDLIAMGKHGQSALEKLLIGSVTNHVLRHSAVPVLVTKEGKRIKAIRKILVPTDFTKEEEAEREFAFKVAQGFGASLTLLYVLELFGHEFRLIREMVKTTEDKFKATVTTGKKDVEVKGDIIKATNAHQGITEYARRQGFDLILMATCVSPLGRFFLGSTTEKVIASTELPVLALPPKYCA